jgi:superfamily II DNA or RNA helicase
MGYLHTTATYRVHLGPVSSHFEADFPSTLRQYLATRMTIEGAHGSEPHHFFAPDTASFLTGVYASVETLLAERHVTMTPIADPRPPCLPRVAEPPCLVTLRDYQETTVDEAILVQRGIIQAAVNSGKSELAMEIIRRLRVPTVYLVPTQRLYEQALEAFQTRLPSLPLGECKAGRFEPALITVAMVQTLSRGLRPVDEGGSEAMRRWLATVECVIADETQHFSSETFRRVFTRATSAPYRFGLSATPFGMGRARDILLKGLTGPPFGTITAKDLEHRGLSVPADVRFIAYPQIQNGLRHVSGREYRTIHQIGVRENDGRARALYTAILPHLDKRERVLVFVDEIAHGDRLALAAPSGVHPQCLYGTESKSERARMEAAFRRGERPLLITTLLKEGVNIPEIDVIVNASGRKAEWLIRQQGGRGVRTRPGKTTVVIYDFIDAAHPTLWRHSHARRAAYEAEQYPVTLVAQ